VKFREQAEPSSREVINANIVSAQFMHHWRRNSTATPRMDREMVIPISNPQKPPLAAPAPVKLVASFGLGTLPAYFF